MAKKTVPQDIGKIESIVSLIEADLADMVKSATAEQLNKAHEGEATSPEVPPNASATSPDPSAGGAPPMMDPSAGGAPPPDASAGGAPPPDADPVAPEGAGEAPPSMDELVQAYSELPPDQLAMHEQALAQVKAQMGGAAGGDPTASAPPPEGSPSPGGPPDAMKSEDLHGVLSKAETHIKTQITEIERLRAELATATGTLVKQEADIKEASRLIELYMASPAMRRAVTATPPAVRPEEKVESLTKSEITGRLRQAMRNPNTSAKDRALVDGYMAHTVDLKQISHLVIQTQAQ